MKLTNAMRSEIVKKATHKAFGVRLEAARELLKQRTIEELNADPSIKKFADIPEEYHEYIGRINRVRYWCDGADEYVELPGNMFASKVGTNGWLQIGDSSNPQDARNPVVKKIKMLGDQMASYREKVKQVVSSVTTTNKLAELSPALSAFIPTNMVDAGNYPIAKSVLDAVEEGLRW